MGPNNKQQYLIIDSPVSVSAPAPKCKVDAETNCGFFVVAALLHVLLNIAKWGRGWPDKVYN